MNILFFLWNPYRPCCLVQYQQTNELGLYKTGYHICGKCHNLLGYFQQIKNTRACAFLRFFFLQFFLTQCQYFHILACFCSQSNSSIRSHQPKHETTIYLRYLNFFSFFLLWAAVGEPVLAVSVILDMLCIKRIKDIPMWRRTFFP
nr:MAG TPA: hypothetical protein [Caudoviricetes sp.]